MNYELERMRKEEVETDSKCYSGVFQKGLWKITKNLIQDIGYPAEIRTKYLQNISPGCYYNTNPSGALIIFGKIAPLLN
jgi:hypothetical protein